MAYEIVRATEATINEVEAWLDEEEAAYQAAIQVWESGEYVDDIPPRGFRCNWDTVKLSWHEGSTDVDILVVDDQAVGFLNGTDILEVRPDVRKSGYGRLLADFMLSSAYGRGCSVVEIEIAPSTAEPFWKRQGFTIIPDRQSGGGGIYAYKVLPRVFKLSSGKRVEFSIEFYTEHNRYSDRPNPFYQLSGTGERLSNGNTQLPERAYCFNPTDSQFGDYFVRIELDGHLLHFDKAKRATSKSYGVQLDANRMYFIDQIKSPTSPG